MMRAPSVLAIVLTLITGAPVLAAEQTAVFAGGRFEDLQPEFDAQDGVIASQTGTMADGTQVVAVRFDDAQVSYDTLLRLYWRAIDPFDNDGQFCARGPAYRPALYVSGDAQAQAARAMLVQQEHRFGQKLAVRIEAAGAITPAAAWQQKYYRRYPSKYRFSRLMCRRDARLREVWGGDAPQ